MESRVELGAIASVDREPAARDPTLVALRIGDRDIYLLREFVAELDFRLRGGRRPRLTAIRADAAANLPMAPPSPAAPVEASLALSVLAHRHPRASGQPQLRGLYFQSRNSLPPI
jgi:hypothetical protein